MMKRSAVCLVLTLAPLAACGDAPERSTPEPGNPIDARGNSTRVQTPPDSVDVVFTRAEAPVVVRRALPGAAQPLTAALEALLAGPTSEERDRGIESWFSGSTAGALRSAAIDANGHAIVDFQDLRSLIPNAASSTGSALLLLELNGTVFQFPEVLSVEYRIDGSCDAFWDWLQYGCQTVRRGDR